MSKKPASLMGFRATKVSASPSPLEAVPSVAPAANDEVLQPAKPAPAEEMVGMNSRVPASFRRELKIYAASIGKDMSEVIREGVELHRQHYGKT